MAIKQSLVFSAALAAALLVPSVRPVSAAPAVSPGKVDAQVAAIARLHALQKQYLALSLQIAQAERVYGPDNPRLRALVQKRQAVRNALKRLPLYTLQPRLPEAPPTSQEVIRRSRVSLLTD